MKSIGKKEEINEDIRRNGKLKEIKFNRFNDKHYCNECCNGKHAKYIIYYIDIRMEASLCEDCYNSEKELGTKMKILKKIK